MLYRRKDISRTITRRHLISRHTSELGVCPTGIFTRPFQIFHKFSSGTRSSGVIMTGQHQTFCGRHIKVSQTNQNKEHYRQSVGNHFLDLVHVILICLIN